MKRINYNYIRYGCGSKEEFELIKDQRYKFNHKVWRIISVVCFMYFVGLFYSTFSLSAIEANAMIYAVSATISFVSAILLLTVVDEKCKFLMPLIYFQCFCLLAFGMMIGTVLSKDFLAVTYHVLLLGITLLIVDNPYKIGILELIMTIIFVIACANIKTGDTRQLDIYNAIVFALLAQIVNYYMVSTKMSQLLATKTIETSSLKDELTNLRNRKAYEEDLETYPTIPTEKDFVYVSLDVNELKIVNDSLGHAAGDELLKGAASCINTCFGAYGRTYRIGGDEFAAIIFANEERLEEIKADFENVYINWTGLIVDQVSISVGYVTKREFPNETVEELAKIADKRMYADKANYYKKKGIDRRGQQAAHTALLGLYTKILKINLTTDAYRIINMDVSEQTAEMGFDETVSGWLSGFGKSGQVHPDDLDSYLSKTDINYLKKYFSEGKNLISIFYRRKNSTGYEEVIMEMIPANDYTEDNQTLFLYVKNIEKNKAYK